MNVLTFNLVIWKESISKLYLQKSLPTVFCFIIFMWRPKVMAGISFLLQKQILRGYEWSERNDSE